MRQLQYSSRIHAEGGRELNLSIVIPSHNDSVELVATVRSIRETAGFLPEVVVVDDATINGSPVLTPDCGQVTLIRTQRRIGVGPARHIGALRAKGEYLLFVDSHSRFLPGWYDTLLTAIADRPTTLHCGQCLGFNSQHLDLANPSGRYFGGTINVYGRDRNLPGNRMQVLEAIWRDDSNNGDDIEIPCVMGANYVIPRDFFFKLDPLSKLKGWGTDETMLSVKAWLSGGNVRLLKQFKVGHKFRLKHERVQFPIPAEHRLRNKIFAILTLLPRDLADKLMPKLRRAEPSCSRILKLMESEWATIEVEREFNRQLFVRDFNWLACRFSLPMPS